LARGIGEGGGGDVCKSNHFRHNYQSRINYSFVSSYTVYIFLGLDPKKHLGRSIEEIYSHMLEMVWDISAFGDYVKY